MSRRARRERDTMEYLQAARRFIRAAGERVAHSDEFELAELVALRTELEDAIRVGVHGQRRYGRSWAHIGAALGITRQSAHEHYGEKTRARRGDAPAPTGPALFDADDLGNVA